jgi:Leucine-rich repeat (LRR) protein
VLDLSHNLLHSIPRTLEALTEMTEVGLSGNRLEKVPRPVCKWTSLHLLYLRDTRLHALRRSLKRLVNLRYLDLSQNHLDQVPPLLCTLKNLEILALDDNKIGQVPIPFLAVKPFSRAPLGVAVCGHSKCEPSLWMKIQGYQMDTFS